MAMSSTTSMTVGRDRTGPWHRLLAAGDSKARALRTAIWLFAARALYTLYRRARSSSVPHSLTSEPKRPFLAFSGSGLLSAYYHGVATYIRDHFHTDDLQVSGISGGCTTILALAMGVDLYQILLLGLHVKKYFLKVGVYLNTFDDTVAFVCEQLALIGLTDQDVEQLSKERRCFIGVTKCFPPGHQCLEVPTTVHEMVALWLCSMSVVPFFKTPGVYQGQYFIDGGFSAYYSVPESQPWNDVIKITCVPWWTTLLPPAMSIADTQPRRFMPTEVVVLYPWKHQCTLIKRGYDDAKRSHDHLVSRGLRPLRNAPLTPWAEWERLFSSIDEDNLPPLSKKCSTEAISPAEKKHMELLRTYSSSDLGETLHGARLRRLSSSTLTSKSEADLLTSQICQHVKN